MAVGDMRSALNAEDPMLISQEHLDLVFKGFKSVYSDAYL
jgi:hypothetical protein